MLKTFTMNRIFIIAIFLLLAACRKEVGNHFEDNDTQKLQSYLAKHSPGLMEEADWAHVEKCLSTETYFRVAIKGKEFSNDFFLFKQDSTNAIEGAKSISIQTARISLNGHIRTTNIATQATAEYKIEGGYLLVNKVTTGSTGSAMASSIDEGYMSPPLMAKVVPDGRGGTQYQYTSLEYINIRQAYDALTQPSNSYHLTGGETKNPYGGGGTYTSTVTGYPLDIVIDKDLYYEQNPVIDIQKMIDCFNSIGDQGAVCSIELMADLPVNDHPTFLTDQRRTYAGHCFLQLKKSNQGKSMTQNIGLYPKSSIKSIATTAQIPGRFVEDNWHAYNASIKINLNFIQLSVILQEIKKINAGGPKYDIDNFNCTDFALKIINLVRPNDPLEPQTYQLPGGPATATGTNLPQGVYVDLVQRMKRSEADRKNIKLTTTNLFSDVSNSPCK
jgi:hypothetical protein